MAPALPSQQEPPALTAMLVIGCDAPSRCASEAAPHCCPPAAAPRRASPSRCSALARLAGAVLSRRYHRLRAWERSRRCCGVLSLLRGSAVRSAQRHPPTVGIPSGPSSPRCSRWGHRDVPGRCAGALWRSRRARRRQSRGRRGDACGLPRATPRCGCASAAVFRCHGLERTWDCRARCQCPRVLAVAYRPAQPNCEI